MSPPAARQVNSCLEQHNAQFRFAFRQERFGCDRPRIRRHGRPHHGRHHRCGDADRQQPERRLRGDQRRPRGRSRRLTGARRRCRRAAGLVSAAGRIPHIHFRGSAMKLRSILLIAFSRVLGVVATALVNRRGQSAPPPSVQIVAAKVGLNFGDHLKPESLRVMNFPPDTVLEGAFAKIEEIAGPGEDRVVLRPMAPGEPVLATKISGTGGKATLSTVVEKGMRAMTIRVNDVTGGGGFVLPQDRVDVMLTRIGQANDTKQTVVLLQNIKVLGIDQQADEQKDKPIVAKAVTLEVTPDDAQKLTLGSSVGSLSLSLRNYANPDAAPTSVISVNDLFAPPPVAPVAGKPV